MATILRSENREFREDPNKMDNFRLFSDVSRIKKGIKPKNLNFDLRLLNPGQYSSAYHSHRHAEEFFLVLIGSITIRTPEGLDILSEGDMVFCEMGETGAHQFYNHGAEPCTYLDIRTYIGMDVCDYPDSGKILIAPSLEIFNKKSKMSYFEGEENILKKWNEVKGKQ